MTRRVNVRHVRGCTHAARGTWNPAAPDLRTLCGLPVMDPRDWQETDTPASCGTCCAVLEREEAKKPGP